MMAIFVGLPGVLELLILLVMCGGPVIVGLILVYFLAIRPQQAKADLIPCPDCGHRVSPRAESCPNCGGPLKPQE
jgi:hypothetical protein